VNAITQTVKKNETIDELIILLRLRPTAISDAMVNAKGPCPKLNATMTMYEDDDDGSAEAGLVCMVRPQDPPMIIYVQHHERGHKQIPSTGYFVCPG